MPQLLAADAASAVALSSRLVAVGTRRGAVVLLDAQGKTARGSAQRAQRTTRSGMTRKHTTVRAQVRRLPPHSGAVNDISFDASGAYVATASEDGTVAVRRKHHASLRRVPQCLSACLPARAGGVRERRGARGVRLHEAGQGARSLQRSARLNALAR